MVSNRLNKISRGVPDVDRILDGIHTAVVAVEEKIPFLNGSGEVDAEGHETATNSNGYVWNEKAQRLQDPENGRFVAEKKALGNAAVSSLIIKARSHENNGTSKTKVKPKSPTDQKPAERTYSDRYRREQRSRLEAMDAERYRTWNEQLADGQDMEAAYDQVIQQRKLQQLNGNMNEILEGSAYRRLALTLADRIRQTRAEYDHQLSLEEGNFEEKSEKEYAQELSDREDRLQDLLIKHSSDIPVELQDFIIDYSGGVYHELTSAQPSEVDNSTEAAEDNAGNASRVEASGAFVDDAYSSYSANGHVGSLTGEDVSMEGQLPVSSVALLDIPVGAENANDSVEDNGQSDNEAENGSGDSGVSVYALPPVAGEANGYTIVNGQLAPVTEAIDPDYEELDMALVGNESDSDDGGNAADNVGSDMGELETDEQEERRLELEEDADYTLESDSTSVKIEKGLSLRRKVIIGLGIAALAGAGSTVLEQLRKGEHDWKYLTAAVAVGALAGLGVARAYVTHETTGKAPKRGKTRALGRAAILAGGILVGTVVAGGSHYLVHEIRPVISDIGADRISSPLSNSGATVESVAVTETFDPKDTNRDHLVNDQDAQDINGDNVIDYQDQISAETFAPLDTNHDGVVNNLDVADINKDGVIDQKDVVTTKTIDPLDTDQNGVVNERDVPDSNGDGVINVGDLPKEDAGSQGTVVENEPGNPVAQDIYVEPGSGITNEIQQYVAATYKKELTPEQLNQMYIDLIKSGDYTPQELFGDVEFFDMGDGWFGMRDTGPAVLTETGQTAINDWLVAHKII